MNFANAEFLWLLLVTLPLLAVFFWWSWRKRQWLITQFVQSRLLAQLTVGVSARRQQARMGLLLLAVASLFLTLARPQWGYDLEEVRQKGLDIVVAIDTSRSMLADDVKPNRLARAKLEALGLIQQAKSDRLGLVAFAGTAFTQCPLTLDDEAFRQSVQALDTSIIPQGGTALAEAIQTALGTFKEDTQNAKALVLFTDGEDNDDEAEAVAAAEKAAKSGLHIFTIGIGSVEGETIHVRDEKGAVSVVKDADGKTVKSHLNEELLRKIAAATQGAYLPLRGARTMDLLYEQGLAKLPKTEFAVKPLKLYHDRYQWPLAVALALLLAEWLVPDRRRAKRGEVAVNAGNESLRQAVALGLLLALPVALGASPARAKRDYEKGKYQEALEEYERLQESRPDDPRLHYNTGAAAYQAQQFEQAITNFNAALNSPGNDLPLQQHAYYNLGNAHYRNGDRAPDPQAKIQSWEEAVKQFDNALKLDSKDADARHNLELVKERLEKLKQQQPKKEKQKPGDKNDQDKSDQDKQDQQKQPDKKPSDDQKKQEQKDGGDKPDEQKPPEQSPQSSPDQPKDKAKDGEQKSAGQPKDKSEDPGQDAEAQAAARGQMTPQQAAQLLEAQKGDERAMIFQPADKGKGRKKVYKDW